MFINLRGTSGSGKTTVIKTLINQCKSWDHIYIDGRKQPIMTIYTFHEFGDKKIAVMGHYATTCGGCDTINKLDDVFKYAHQAIEDYGVKAVIAEGLLLGKDVSRIVTMDNPHLVYIDTPIEDCYDGVRRRRWAKVVEKYGSIEAAPQDVVDKIKAKPKALENDHRGILSTVNRLRDKVTVHDVTRDTALETILKLLK